MDLFSKYGHLFSKIFSFLKLKVKNKEKGESKRKNSKEKSIRKGRNNE
jgi:hypothetical protein